MTKSKARADEIINMGSSTTAIKGIGKLTVAPGR